MRQSVPLMLAWQPLFGSWMPAAACNTRRSLHAWRAKGPPKKQLHTPDSNWRPSCSYSAVTGAPSSHDIPNHISLERPPQLVQASMRDVHHLLPFSYEICSYRHRSFESRGMVVQYAPQSLPPASPCRAPHESFLEMTYPLSCRPLLRDLYERFDSGLVRTGLLLEDLDTFAADVAARHTWGGGSDPEHVKGRVMLTGALDHIAWYKQHWQQQQQPYELGDAARRVNSDSGSDGGSSSSSASSSSGAAAVQPPLATSRPMRGFSLSVHQDMRVAGQVTWAGSSSMEVVLEISTRGRHGGTCDVEQPAAATAAPPAAGASSNECSTNNGKDSGSSSSSGSSSGDSTGAWQAAAGDRGWQLVGVARFVMVCRDAAGRAARVPAMTPATHRQRHLFEAGAARQAARRAARQAAADLVPPAGEELQLLFSLIVQQQQARRNQQQMRQTHQNDHEQQHALQRRAPVPMARTKLLYSALMHRQDRNTTHRIFGGHLLRGAFEVAYQAAALHAGSHCEALSMGDVSFLQPVPIGCILQYQSKVVFTDGPLLRVSVQAFRRDLRLGGTPTTTLASSGAGAGAGASGSDQQGRSALTNRFSFAFVCSEGDVAPVVPVTLTDAIDYLAAHSQHRAEGFATPAAAALAGLQATA